MRIVVKSSKERDALEQTIINIIAGLCIVAEYCFGVRVDVICVSIILVAILLTLFHVWNRLESIRFMMSYRFDKDFLQDDDGD